MNSRAGHISNALMEQYLAVGLPQSDALALETHLQACSDCRCLRDVFCFWGELQTSR